MSRKEKRDFGKKMRAGWSEAKLAEWKAGWKAKSANWKKKKGRQAPAEEAGEVSEPLPKRKRKNEAERLWATLRHL